MTNKICAPATGRGEARRRSLLDAASALFLERGYERTTLTDVLDRSGGSRTTLYEQFGGKEGIFLAVMQEGCIQLGAAFDELAVTDDPPEQVLYNLGSLLVLEMLSMRSMPLGRIVIAEGPRFPELARLFWEQGPDKARTQVADYLVRVAAKEGWELRNPRTASCAFMGMVETAFLWQGLIGLEIKETEEQALSMVRDCVDMFLNGLRPRGKAVEPGCGKPGNPVVNRR